MPDDRLGFLAVAERMRSEGMFLRRRSQGTNEKPEEGHHQSLGEGRPSNRRWARTGTSELLQADTRENNGAAVRREILTMVAGDCHVPSGAKSEKPARQGGYWSSGPRLSATLAMCRNATQLSPVCSNCPTSSAPSCCNTAHTQVTGWRAGAWTSQRRVASVSGRKDSNPNWLTRPTNEVRIRQR